MALRKPKNWTKNNILWHRIRPGDTIDIDALGQDTSCEARSPGKRYRCSREAPHEIHVATGKEGTTIRFTIGLGYKPIYAVWKDKNGLHLL